MKQSSQTKITILGGRHDSTRIIYNRLAASFDVRSVVLERRQSRTRFLKRRIRRLGVLEVLGQIAFRVGIAPLLQQLGRTRIEEIIDTNQLDRRSIPSSELLQVDSVNDDQTRQRLERDNPDVVVISGTRIIASKILDAIDAPFVNIHAGITPAYRGVHGGYWALAQDDPERCGVTVHLVDEGIDTGNVLAQKRIEPTQRDNFATYPYLQLAEGILLLEDAINRLVEGDTVQPAQMSSDSKLWTHPTAFQYLKTRFLKGIH